MNTKHCKRTDYLFVIAMSVKQRWEICYFLCHFILNMKLSQHCPMWHFDLYVYSFSTATFTFRHGLFLKCTLILCWCCSLSPLYHCLNREVQVVSSILLSLMKRKALSIAPEMHLPFTPLPSDICLSVVLSLIIFFFTQKSLHNKCTYSIRFPI